jgi:hypothetical protein
MGAATAIPSALSIASAGLSAYGSFEKGKGQEAADEYKAQELQRQAEIGKIKATEVSGQMTEHLNQTLGNIDAIRAAAHDDPTSPTGAAVRDLAESQGIRQKNIGVTNILEQSAQDQADAAYMQRAGALAMQGGEISAGADVLKALGSTDWTKFGLGKTPSGGSTPRVGYGLY